MGHSTVSFTVKGKLSFSEIGKEFKSRQEQDREQYGYEESPDSLYRASSPSSRYLGSIYSPFKANKIIDEVCDYSSICLYTVSRGVFMELYKKEFKKIEKIKTEIKRLNEVFMKASNSVTEGINKKSITKDIFFITPCCKSKINATAVNKRGYKSLRSCPVCESHHENTFETFWRAKNLGNTYSKLKNKIDSKINLFKNKISDIEKSLPEKIDENKLNKKQKLEILTIVAADVHH